MTSHACALKRCCAAAAVLILVSCLFALCAESLRADDADWGEYPANPVYDPATGRAYYPCVIYDADRFSGHGDAYYYKMWYGNTDATRWQWVAYSNDGINWENAEEVSGIASHGYHAKLVYVAGGYGAGPYFYKIWYWDPDVSIYGITAMRTADSADGVTWVNDQVLTQDASHPLVTGVWPDWNRGSYGPVHVLHNPSASNSGGDPFEYSFAMYYDGTTGGVEVTGLGYSTDGNHWSRFGDEPVLGLGAPGEWDSDYASHGTVVRESDGVWHLWYSGGGPSSGGNQGIGYASSADGINWTKSPGNPLLYYTDGVAWRDNRTYTPSVIYRPDKFGGHGGLSRFKMWFTGRSSTGNYAIGHMASLDPELSLSKTASPPGEITRGSVVTYTLAMRNEGGGPSSGAKITDAVPAFTSYMAGTTTLNGASVEDAGGTTPVSAGMQVNSPGQAPGVIAPGGEAVVTFTVQVGSDLPPGASLRNTATAEAEGIPPLEASCVNDSAAQLPATWYFAEGSTQAGFDEYLLLSNMSGGDMTVTITYISETGPESSSVHVLPANSRRTVYVNSEKPGESGLAAVVKGEEGLICERSMYFQHNGIAGGDDVVGTNAPSVDLFFAEGFTGTPHSPFEEWLLVLNPNDAGSELTVDYLFPGGESESRTYQVPGRRRLSINVDREVGEGREVSARLRSELPVVAERAMYFLYKGVWAGGHNGVAATGARGDWYLAEGYTGWEGSPFDEWILVANENTEPAAVTVTYMFPDGTTRLVEHDAPARGRLTISADEDVGEGMMVSAHIHSDLPVVVERAMYFAYRDAWDGGHNCLGAPSPAADFYFAEGYTGDSGSRFETWVLIQNTSGEEKTADISYFLPSGDSVKQEVKLQPHSRSSVLANQVLDREGLEFSIRVTSRDGSPVLLAERAMYFDYAGPLGSSGGGHDVMGY